MKLLFLSLLSTLASGEVLKLTSENFQKETAGKSGKFDGEVAHADCRAFSPDFVWCSLYQVLCSMGTFAYRLMLFLGSCSRALTFDHSVGTANRWLRLGSSSRRSGRDTKLALSPRLIAPWMRTFVRSMEWKDSRL